MPSVDPLLNTPRSKVRVLQEGCWEPEMRGAGSSKWDKALAGAFQESGMQSIFKGCTILAWDAPGTPKRGDYLCVWVQRGLSLACSHGY